VRAIRCAVFAIASVVIVAGCSGGPAPNAQPTDEAGIAYHDTLVRARAEAELGGADEAQLAILDEALATNEITFEQEQQVVNAFGACLESGGFALVDLRVTDEGGFKLLRYAVRAGDDDTTTVMDECEVRTLRWVDYLYQTQPAAIRAQDATFEQALPGLITCLQAGGVPVDDGSPADEVKQVMLAYMNESIPESSDSTGGNPAREPDAVSSCLMGAGLEGF
jgi:hypothetical protein